MTARQSWMCVLAIGLAACSDDASSTPDDSSSSSSSGGTGVETTTTADTSGGSSSTGGMTTADTSGASSTSGPDPDSSSTGAGSSSESSSSTTEPPGPAVEFFVRIENISGESVLPTTLSGSMWIEHELGSTPVLTAVGIPDAGAGLASFAEDGDATDLLASVTGQGEVVQADLVGALAPGEMVEFNFSAQEGNRLSLFTPVGAGNDAVIGTGPVGLALFQNNGTPHDERDVSGVLSMYEVGSEFNEAPGLGAQQLATQAQAGAGMDETGQVVRFESSTRALPLATAFVQVDVSEDLLTPGLFTIAVNNVGDSGRGTVFSPLSPIVWAQHDDTFTMFDIGDAVGDHAGLEAFAEDADPTEFADTVAAALGVSTSAVVGEVILPGEGVQFVVQADAAHRFVSFATMVEETNCAFVAPLPGGVALAEEDGTPRSLAAIEEDFAMQLAVWDAGSEVHEVPGVGANIRTQQVAPGDGTPDVGTIQLWHDTTNDLAGDSAGGFVTVTVVNGLAPGDFDVTIENTAGGTAFPGLIAPVVWAVHDDTIALFDEDGPASPALEDLAEDGDGAAMLGDLMGDAAVAASDLGVATLGPGDSYAFTVTADGGAPFLSFAAMVIPSNDTFIATVPAGIRLVADNGDPLSDPELAAAASAGVLAWEAGTEANQGGGIGRDQLPRQAGLNTGVDEGPSVVQFLDDDAVWFWPDPARLVRVTVGPTGN